MSRLTLYELHRATEERMRDFFADNPGSTSDLTAEHLREVTWDVVPSDTFSLLDIFRDAPWLLFVKPDIDGSIFLMMGCALADELYDTALTSLDEWQEEAQEDTDDDEEADDGQGDD